jgi:hypothetical protein
MDKDKLSQKILNLTPAGKGKEGDQKQDGKKRYPEL